MRMSNLKRLRKSIGLTQLELSKLSGVSKRSIQHYEQGTKDINKVHALTLYKFSKILNCEIVDLMEFDKIEDMDDID